VTQDELIEAGWGKVVMSESLLRTHVRDVRSVLGDDVIETVTGRGYRFVADVETGIVIADLQPLLVGRAGELSNLREHFEAALTRKRQMAFVMGAAGIGKTALVDAVLEQATAAGALVARGSCVEQYGSGEAYLPVLSALTTLCRGPRGDRVIEVMARHAPTWLCQIPGLVADAKLAELQLRVQGATPARMLRELADGLEVLSADAPIVLALDDLQWSDNCTAELLAMLGRRRDPARLFVVATCRHTELTKADAVARVIGELSSHRQAATLVLESLTVDAVSEYVGRRWPGDRFPQIASPIHEASSGNPLFMIALADDLEGRGMVRQVDGQWELFATMDEISARRPDTVRQLIDIQIDRLDPSQQRVLEAASVAGLEFAIAAVAHALEMSVDDVETCCEALADQERFLRFAGTEAWPDGTLQARYSFVHALYREAANARSSSATIRGWHRRIGERLEAGHGNATEAIASELAAHFDAGQNVARAIHHYNIAGLRAEQRLGGVEARRHFERARELLIRLPESRERDAIEMNLLRRLGRAMVAANVLENTQLVAVFTRAAELAKQLGADAIQGAALVGLQQARMLRGALREIDDHAAEVRQLATRIDDPQIAAWGTLMAAAAALHRGRIVEARRQLRENAVALDGRNRRVAPSDGPSFPYGPLLFSNLALAEWLAGYPDAALVSALESVSIAESLEDPFTLCLGLAAAAAVQMWRRDPRASLDFARRGMHVATEAGSGLGIARTVSLYYLAAVEVGEVSAVDSLAEIEKALTLHAPSSGAGRTQYRLTLVGVAMRAGKTDRALSEIADALAYAEQYDERAWEPELYRLRGELLQSTDPRAAEKSLATAVEIAQRHGSRSLELRALLSLHRTSVGDARPASLDGVRRLYASFTEGSRTGDLVDAKRLIDQA
jgi:predicted negative regulator of RcsB-dependent stress response